jgi:hypothetical protein
MAIKKWYVGCFSRDNKLIGGKVLCKNKRDAIARAVYADKSNVENILKRSNHNISIPDWIDRYKAFFE